MHNNKIIDGSGALIRCLFSEYYLGKIFNELVY